jgi:hypothetical protein
MSPELCLCSKNLGLLHLSHTDDWGFKHGIFYDQYSLLSEA